MPTKVPEQLEKYFDNGNFFCPICHKQMYEIDKCSAWVLCRKPCEFIYWIDNNNELMAIYYLFGENNKKYYMYQHYNNVQLGSNHGYANTKAAILGQSPKRMEIPGIFDWDFDNLEEQIKTIWLFS